MWKGNNMQKPSRTFSFTVGAFLGLFLATFGIATYLNGLNIQPEVKVVTVTKTVTKHVTEVVKVPVFIQNKVTVHEVEHKLYRAVLLDESGKVTQSWEVTKCRFIVIGAQLTDKSGKTFKVVGQIRIEPIK
jgi:hypothetical protein